MNSEGIVIKFDRSKNRKYCDALPSVFDRSYNVFPPIIVKRGYTFFKKDTNMFIESPSMMRLNGC